MARKTFYITTFLIALSEFPTLNDFQYAAPTTIDDAVQLLAQYGDRAKVLAGGTDIIVQLREGLRSADMVVDAKKIPELMQLDFSPTTGLRLGASVPCYQVYENAELQKAYPALCDSTRIIGGWQIQSRASVGGNLCNSSPAADCIPSLIVHTAVAHIAGPGGRRTVPIQEFCIAPGKNVLAPGELLVALTLPPPAIRASSAYERFTPRNEMDITVAGAGSWLLLEEGANQIKYARIALAAVAATTQFAKEASDFLVGKEPTDDILAEAGELAKKVASPIDDMRGTIEYRTHLVGVLTKRTLARAAQRANDKRPVTND